MLFVIILYICIYFGSIKMTKSNIKGRRFFFLSLLLVSLLKVALELSGVAAPPTFAADVRVS